MKRSVWPSGPYALLMPSTGCPESEAHGWGKGYIYFKTVNRVGVWEVSENDSENGPLLSHPNVLLSSVFTNYSLQMNFCFKNTQPELLYGSSKWPISRVSVFAVEHGCPEGFVETPFEIFLPPISSWRTDGHLPYFSITETTNGTHLLTKTCFLNEWNGFPGNNKTQSFVVVQNNNEPCSTESPLFTVEDNIISVRDVTTNDTLINQYAKLRFCVYSQVEVVFSNWPDDPFALLFPPTGCPPYPDWSINYIQFRTYPDVIEAHYDGDMVNTSLYYTDFYGDETFFLKFCYKEEVERLQKTPKWPRGEYSILKVKDECPDGFIHESIPVELPSIREWYEHGNVPIFNVHPNKSEVILEACRHMKGDNIDVLIPSDSIFWSIKSVGHHTGTPFDGFQMTRINLNVVETADPELELNKEFHIIIDEYKPFGDTGCDESMYLCDSHTCFYKSDMCDGSQRCADGTDEHDWNCALKCPFPEFLCDGDSCVQKAWLCDGFVHCYDGQDEIDSNCYDNNVTKGAYLDDEFTCDGKCLPVTWVCDGYRDCSDGIDESRRFCEIHTECPEDEFRCGSGGCISRDLVCDGIIQCPDKSDETDCTFGSKTFCETGIGITDGTIEDKQLSASSWRESHLPQMARPSTGSWCAAPGDDDPYLQIDLCYISLIKSLTLFNNIVQTKATNDVQFKLPTLEVMGTRSFLVSYGISLENFTYYDEKPFEQDVCLHPEIPQHFTFWCPFIARIVRIHPLLAMDNDKLCLQLELAGCSVERGSNEDGLSKRESINQVDIIVADYTLITSYGFPRHYESDRLFMWNIATDYQGYLRLTFETVDLHSVTSRPDSNCTMDRIQFSEDFIPITSALNGLTPTFPTDKHQLLLIFHTCKRLYRKNDRRKGFRLIVKREGEPTIWGRLTNAELDQGRLYTHSMLGLISVSRSFTWLLDSSAFEGHVAMLFRYFNFPENTGHSVRMKIGHLEYETYNNKNRPTRVIQDWIILIEVNFDGEVAYPFPVGISAQFQFFSASKYYEQLGIEESMTVSTEISDEIGQASICSDELKKCYYLGFEKRAPTTTMAFQTQRKWCRIKGSTLIGIHSRKEQNFLHSWFWHRLNNLRLSGVAKNFQIPSFEQFYTYIGLIRPGGFTWIDGTKVSFTNWGDNQPDRSKDNTYTVLRVGLSIEDSKWFTEDIYGDDGHFHFFSCETPFKKTYSALSDEMATNSELKSEEVLELVSTILVQCNSSEYISQLVVCDGVPDCLDGSDEYDCDLKKADECSVGFVCKSGECIPIWKACNFIKDCLDGSDELCDFPPCAVNQFRCLNDQCISSSRRCDAQQDCLDASDESQCTSCNSAVAFKCDDLTCIHSYQVCNDIADCSNGADENNCEITYSTCHDYWLRGSDVASIQHPEYGKAECRVEYSRPGRLVMSTIFDINGHLEKQENGLQLTITKHSLTDYGYGYGCHFQIVLACSQSVREIDRLRHLFSNATSSTCTTKTYSISFYPEKRYPTRYTEDEYSELMIVYLPMQVSIYFTHKRSLPVRDQFFLVYPMRCTRGFSGPHQIRCLDGTVVPESLRCLYDVSRAGVIVGCRNLKHLEGCETFSCPSGYAKCPSSFCIVERFICDGERNCPGGEDEIGCECRERNTTLFVIRYHHINSYEESMISQFAKKFYSETAQLIELSVSQYNPWDFSIYIENVYYVYKSEVSQHYGALETIYLEHIDGSFRGGIFNLTNSIGPIIVIIIQDHELIKDRLTDTFINAPFVDHLYNMRIDTSIRQPAIVNTSTKQTDVILNSWETLGNVKSNILPGVCIEEIRAHCMEQYRCSSSRICIPLTHVCDGEKQCPFGDDESVCDFQCPDQCSCELYVADCRSRNFTEEDLQILNSLVRALDISQNDVFVNNSFILPNPLPFLLYLNASRCNLNSIIGKTFSNTPNLIELDISFNIITHIEKDTFGGLVNLKSLGLSGNSYLMSIEPRAFEMLSKMSSLSITHAQISVIYANTFSGLKLKRLDISNNKIQTLHANAFNNLSVEDLYIDGNDINIYGAGVFNGIQDVKGIWSPSFHLCCYKPTSVDTENCLPQLDEFSSCDDLMRNSILQTLLWVIGIIALLGNVSTLTYRLLYNKAKIASGYSMFVSHLAVSDFLMGVYMITIAIADLSFRQRYVEMDKYWRHSVWCKAAGVLAAVSSETSILLMCLITIDRFLVIKFPFGQWRFSKQSSRLAVLSSWLISWILAMLPLVVDGYFENVFYSRSGVCLALPFSRTRRPGWLYSFLIYIALNFVAFILIAIGQFAIFLEIMQTSKRMKNVRSQRRGDIGIAKNLLLVLATDFICWFPIGIMAILAYDGYEIPRDIHAYTAVLILPANSALNPFLYTLSSFFRDRKANQKSVEAGNDRRKDAGALNRSQSKPTRVTPREAMVVFLLVARRLNKLHQRDIVYGEPLLDNTVIESAAKRFQVYLPLPRKSSDPVKDKKTDMRNAGTLFESILSNIKVKK